MTVSREIRTCSGCLGCPVRSASDWSVLPSCAATMIDRMKRTRHLERGTTLFEQGEANEGLYCVSSGLFGLRMSHASGTEALIGLGWPGQTLGGRAFLRNSAHATTAVALTPATVCMIGRRDALHLTVQAPTVHMALVGRCLAAMDEAQGGLLDSAALSNRDRLCALLLRLVRSGLDDVVVPRRNGGVAVTLPMSRLDLAGMLGVQPETLSRLIARLRAEGLVRLDGRVIEVPSTSRLTAEIARFSCATGAERAAAGWPDFDDS